MRFDSKRTLGAVVVGLVIMMSAQVASAALHPWLYKRAIEVTNSDSMAQDQAVLIELTPANFTYANANMDGSDVRFTTDSTGNTVDLDHYIESWVTGGTSLIWVRVTNVPANGTLDLYMYYGDPTLTTTGSDFNTTFPNAFVSSGNGTVSGTNTYDWFEVQSGDTVTISPAGSVVEIRGGRVKIDGTLDGTAAGYAGSPASTSGGSPSGGPGGGLNGYPDGGGGGAYGGDGGNGAWDSSPAPGQGGTANGSATQVQIDMGSGGGACSAWAGANGGGAIDVQALKVSVSGSIIMDGGDASPGGSYGSGGGAGGGILLAAFDLDVTGATLSADGGDGGTPTVNEGGGGGGGGRIKLFHQNSTTGTANMSVAGGIGGGGSGFNGPSEPGVIGSTHTGTITGLSVPVTLTTFGMETAANRLEIAVTYNGNMLADQDVIRETRNTAIAGLNIAIDVTSLVAGTMADVTTTITNVTTQGIMLNEWQGTGIMTPQTFSPTSGTLDVSAVHEVEINATSPGAAAATPFRFTIIVGPELEVRDGSTVIGDGGSYTAPAIDEGTTTDLSLGMYSLNSDSIAIESIDIVNVTGGAQVWIPNPPGSVPGSGSGTLFIAVQPNGTASYSFDIVINNDTVVDPYTVSVSGTVTAKPEITVLDTLDLPTIAGGDVNAGNLELNSSSDVTLHIRNDGSADLTASGGSAITVSGQTGVSVNLTSATFGPVTSGSMADVTMQVTPSAEAFSFELTIRSNDDDEGTYKLTVYGTASDEGAPSIRLSLPDGRAVDFAEVIELGRLGLTSTSVMVTIHNVGTANLELRETQVAFGTNTTTSANIGGSNVAAGSDTTLNVSIDPDAAGAFTTQVLFATNDPNRESVGVTFTGVAANSGPSMLIRRLGGGAFARMGTDWVNNASENIMPADGGIILDYEIVNTGTDDLEIMLPVQLGVVANLSAEVINQPLETTLGANQTTRFRVLFTPNRAAEFHGTVEVLSNDDRSPFMFNVRGNVVRTSADTSGGGGCVFDPNGTNIWEAGLLAILLLTLGLVRRRN